SFLGETVVQGSIDGAGATLAAVPGTVGASGYALAENGASIVFTQRDNVNLMKVPSAGGTPVVVGPVTPRTGVQLLGVSCQGAGCVVALGPAPLFLSPVVPAKGSPYELRSVSLATGATSTVLSLSNPGLSSPVYLASGDVVVQEGPGLGRLQTSNSQLNTLHLFRNLVH
ncbi:MAG: hypothetical protein ACRELE_10705, partial [Gemmatimonadales bacterium]